jgi:iron uptake system component EfeO
MTSASLIRGAELRSGGLTVVPRYTSFATRDANRPRLSRRGAAGVTAALLAVALGACGWADGAAGAKTIKVALTDAGCEPATINAAPGATTFAVANGGTSKVSEFEILDGKRIVGEVENIVAGLDGRFTLNLKPGEYTTACPGGSTSATGRLIVKGAAPAQAANAQLDAATRGYTSYVETQAAELKKRVAAFAAAVKAGDTAKAKALFASARAPYETIEPVAESFGDLDPEIDARINDVAKGDTWTGFHRIEQGLWQKGSTAGLSPYADKLVKDVNRLVSKVQGLEYEPEELANGATGLLGEVSKSKITGEEDRYSHTDLSDFEANVLGSQAAFGLLVPALRKNDSALAATVQRRFKSVLAGLEPYRRGDGFVSYDKVGQADRRKLSQLVDALAEPLSRVAAKLRA